MEFEAKIRLIQSRLRKEKIDGWLLYDYRGSNRPLKRLFLAPFQVHSSRRFYYWIPERGSPEKIVQVIEREGLHALPGKENIYHHYYEFKERLADVLRGCKRIALDFSPSQLNPAISWVDPGTVELVRELNLQPVSSAPLLEEIMAILDEQAVQSHLRAMKALKATLERCWQFIARRISSGESVTEYEVQEYILKGFQEAGCVTVSRPICASGVHTSLAHYSPSPKGGRIQKGELVLIDLWCREEAAGSVYADITEMAVVDARATDRQVTLFEVVKEAQGRAIAFIEERLKEGNLPKGSEVDACARASLVGAGFGPYFLHRTGHSIDTEVHGGGTHLDSYESIDERHLMPSTCFSIEPGIYLPREMGIRLETNALITPDLKLEVTGGRQRALHTLL